MYQNMVISGLISGGHIRPGRIWKYGRISAGAGAGYDIRCNPRTANGIRYVILYPSLYGVNGARWVFWMMPYLNGTRPWNLLFWFIHLVVIHVATYGCAVCLRRACLVSCPLCTRLRQFCVNGIICGKNFTWYASPYSWFDSPTYCLPVILFWIQGIQFLLLFLCSSLLCAFNASEYEK